MRILVVAGSCLRVNSSANLCHISYINGLLEAGHQVDLISVSEKDQNIDESIILPPVSRVFQYDASMYSRFGARRNHIAKTSSLPGQASSSQSKTLKRRILSTVKLLLRNLYGVYGTERAWIEKAKWFYEKEPYDVVLSLAYPPASHRLVELLLHRNRIKTNKWVQIWEDPWYTDIFGYTNTPAIKKEEYRLLKSAQYIYYVSPLTLMYQQESFPDCNSKMHWQPLPTYYSSNISKLQYDQLVFGYFGDYVSHIRNLRPFYTVARDLNLRVNICGKTDLITESTDKLCIKPRISVGELKKYEDETNVLVFLCNLKGGQIPGKIYQYAATNKLVLFILDGTEQEKTVLRDFFGKYERFIFCDNTYEDICHTIQTIRKYISLSNYTTPLNCFSPSKIIGEILDVE